jgi:hypothetical protein
MIKMKIGSKDFEVDGVELQMDTAPFLKNDRTFVPIRFVAEGMKLNVEWDNDTQEVTVYGRKIYFDSMNECAIDWCMYWNCYSLASAREISGIIYKDEKGYYWDGILVGQPDTYSVAFDLVQAKKGVAIIHSHSTEKPTQTDGNGSDDIKISNKYKIPIYMVNSSGDLYLYNPINKKDIKVRGGLPCDARHLDITKSAELQKEYFSMGYHSIDEYKDGYKADFYNKVHMKGLSYLTEGAVK